ncbi:hypothetical protein GJ654_08405 [Rhodoblastus acidophilus]|uniref:Uncharacterized protein n=1 Tax=Rhodoblastus acidophilus TaxID=1074 RepID=A0A6N8DN88_RHOAC|nr:hypothetical protein [Rhodoblastus acidophilus]MCW2273839.1 exonuclease VII small subunit [Rhodoblastus acidophilus]MTV31015.1 hypothetical protein [Rhodoblastus acidophilus]
MFEHLERALVELYYAVAEFERNEELSALTPLEVESVRARLIVARSNLERLIIEDNERKGARSNRMSA